MLEETDSKLSIDPNTQETKGEQTPKDGKVFDPFDPENLKLTDADRADLGVIPVIVELPARKPKAQEWVRTHPDLKVDVVLFKLEDSGEFYLVSPELRIHEDLFETAKPFRVQLAVNRTGSVFLWPARIPDDGGAGASWHRSAMSCQVMAAERWVRVVSDMHAGAYVPKITEAVLPQPKWPDMTLRNMLELCFRARYIENPDHHILKMLRGEE